jgi:hypothetical protein
LFFITILHADYHLSAALYQGLSYHDHEAPNARINPPGNNEATANSTMRAMLTPVGFNELLDRLQATA